jgi:hypothetical protein
MSLLEYILIYFIMIVAFIGLLFVIAGHINFYSALNKIEGGANRFLLTLIPPLMFLSFPYKDDGYENLRTAYKWWLRGVVIIAIAMLFRFIIQYGFHGEF